MCDRPTICLFMCICHLSWMIMIVHGLTTIIHVSQPITCWMEDQETMNYHGHQTGNYYDCYWWMANVHKKAYSYQIWIPYIVRNCFQRYLGTVEYEKVKDIMTLFIVIGMKTWRHRNTIVSLLCSRSTGGYHSRYI